MSDGLELISGMVSSLTIHDGEQAFLSEAQQGSGAAVAAGLATAGLAGAAAGAGLAATSTGDAVQFFTCQLGERTVAGGFSKVTFKNGDEVSFVVARQPRAADRALAAIRPRDHTLWMSLHCSRGVRAHRRFAYGVFFATGSGFARILLCQLFGIKPVFVWPQNRCRDISHCVADVFYIRGCSSDLLWPSLLLPMAPRCSASRTYLCRPRLPQSFTRRSAARPQALQQGPRTSDNASLRSRSGRQRSFRKPA
ncbi:Uncharacterised protein [Ralstonia mannitolilytica]|uniref:Uncharacterized protein n=1 Tax=Ralstonia mannitolilytica TaxID=105219 RepID=A0AAJ5D6P4_9RALS|nr:hypothetical protein LMG6866_01103 [Ralstonia mannitolilytica]CAJ0737091.1 hypothetical protein R77592_04214 [Ralstonia mannitolilytica]SUE24152.1 Uncharacterised protein [Ralstonia mannitolilytica]SUE25957.1 Uncharacterised protein [Ralstonia mannitolilytica]SUE35767.1 Uncharacterised protein [Ralstonia mannitolilytica]